jgi:hypothetical protein
LEGEESGEEFDGEVLGAQGGVEEGGAFAAFPEFIQGDAGGGGAFDVEAGSAEQIRGGFAGEEVEVGAVEGAAVHPGEVAEEEHKADGEVGDVREGDDEVGVVGGDSSQLVKDGKGVGEVLQDVGADDAVVGLVGEVSVFDGAGVDGAVEGAGVVGPVLVGFDGVDRQVGVFKKLAEEALGAADVKGLPGAKVPQEPGNLLVAALRVVVKAVVQPGSAIGGGGSIGRPLGRS